MGTLRAKNAKIFVEILPNLKWIEDLLAPSSHSKTKSPTPEKFTLSCSIGAIHDRIVIHIPGL
jgi:hypothetical protein